MSELGVTIEDLQNNQNLPEITDKFPLEVYYSDGTHSSDVGVTTKGRALGVIINNTVYPFPWLQDKDNCKKYGFDNVLNLSGVVTLYKNIRVYNQIAKHFGEGVLPRYIKYWNYLSYCKEDHEHSSLETLLHDVEIVFDMQLGMVDFVNACRNYHRYRESDRPKYFSVK